MEVSLVGLPHPGTPWPSNSSPSTFLVAKRSGGEAVELLEVVRGAEGDKLGSWLVGDSVLSDGSLNMATKVDATFWALAALERKRAVAMPLDQLLHEVDASSAALLERCIGTRYEHLCDVQKQLGMTIVKLNDDKATEWLVARTERVAAHFAREIQAKSIAECLAGTSSGFVMVGSSTSSSSSPSSMSSPSPPSPSVAVSPQNAAVQREALRRALQLVVDYLQPRWRSLLCERMGFTEKEVAAAEPSPANGAPAKSKTWEELNGYVVPVEEPKVHASSSAAPSTSAPGATGSGSSANVEAPAKKLKPSSNQPQPSLAARKLAAVNTKGMRNISSFFGAKPPAPAT